MQRIFVQHSGPGYLVHERGFVFSKVFPCLKIAVELWSRLQPILNLINLLEYTFSAKFVQLRLCNPWRQSDYLKAIVLQTKSIHPGMSPDRRSTQLCSKIDGVCHFNTFIKHTIQTMRTVMDDPININHRCITVNCFSRQSPASSSRLFLPVLDSWSAPPTAAGPARVWNCAWWLCLSRVVRVVQGSLTVSIARNETRNWLGFWEGDFKTWLSESG